jgi:tetratricopeptide (TPR) repeat protein
MTGNSSFDQKNQSVITQTNIEHVDKVIIQPSDSALPLPQQIPSPPFDFTGREEEIKSLIDRFDQGATITGLRGMGGIGKTALALVLADRLKDLFPDGQLFLNMLGTSKNPLTPEEAMAHIIRSYLGFDVKLPADKNGLGGLYRSVLSGKRALILLDNAASRAQVEPLLPPPDCSLLVTSRSKFALPGLKEKDIDVLPLEDAKDLLLSICGRIGEHTEKLAELCGCLPIALRNAAYALREKPNISVAGHMKKLADARKRLELVEASFSSSYDLLTPELQRLWSLLSVFPADFDLEGAAAVWERECDAAEEALGELVKWSLVDFMPSASGDGGRYKLHDLARDFTGSRMDDVACELARLRHARHYQKLLWAANELFLQGKDSLSKGLNLFDINRMNIQFGQKWASEKKLVCNEIAKICSNFALGSNILELRLHPMENIEWQEAALISARQIVNRNAEGSHLGNMGLAYAALGDARRAIHYHKQSLQIYRDSGDRREEGSCLGNIGIAFKMAGDYDEAVKCHQQHLDIAREIRDRRGESHALGNLGIAYRKIGELNKAINCTKESLIVAGEVGDRKGELNSLGELGISFTELKRYQDAREALAKALAITKDIADRRGECRVMCNLGYNYDKSGDIHTAIDYYKQCIAIAVEIGDRECEGIALLGQSRMLFLTGEIENANNMAKLALMIFEKIKSPHAEYARNVLKSFEFF